MKINTALILCAGLGKRLNPLTLTKPKPLLDIDSITTAEPKGALSDYQHASEFIYSYRGSPDTFATYRREIEHFLHWSWLVAEKSIKDLLRQDLEAYVEFTKSPPPAWIGKKNVLS